MVVDIVYGKKQREDSFEPSDVCIVPPAESLKSFLFGSVPLEKLGFNMNNIQHAVTDKRLRYGITGHHKLYFGGIFIDIILYPHF